MNERTRHVDLDTYAHQAAAGLRQSVREAELTSNAPRPAGGRRLVALAVAAIVLIGGFVILTRGGDDPSEGGIASSGVATPLAPDPVPDGMAFTGAFEGPIAAGEGEQLPDFTVYRGPEGSAVSLVGLANTGEPEAAGPGVETVVRGGRDYLVEPVSGGEVVSWNESDRVAVLIGRGLTRDQLLTAAAATTVDEFGRIEVGADAVPADLTLVGTVPYGVATPMATAIATLDGSGGIGYADADQTRTLEVVFAIAEDGWLEASEALMHQPRRLEVRGQPAIGGAVGEGQTGATLAWVEPDGTFVRLTGYGLSVDDLVNAAETLEPLTPEEWQALLDQSETERGQADQEATSGTDSASATTFEAVGEPIDDEPLLAFEPAGEGDAAAFVGPIDDPGAGFEVTADQMPSIQFRRTADGWLYGVVPANTERLVVGGGDEEVVVTSFQNIAGGGIFPAWAFIVQAPDQRGITLTAHLEDGSTVVAQT